ncbi:MAG: lysophospholipid acyltransferase family protein [Planctomycetaceae bacterium]|nr:lysophospholipid acyltransferase family protein [Planctomycetaceae bacterium]
MDRRALRYRAEYLAFLTLLFAVQCLPVRASFRLADGLAWIIHRVLPRKATRYAVAAENIRTAFGDHTADAEVDRIIHGMWRHLFRMVIEIIQLPRRFRLYNCERRLDFFQREECVGALCSGRPVLFLGGHFGNWEISVNTFGHFQFPTGVVARPLDNPWLHAWFRRFRECTGNSLIDKNGAGNELVTLLERGGMASLLCDQDAGRGGVFVDFFGKPASTFKSIALLALQYDALIVVGGAFRLPETSDEDQNWVRFNLATEEVIDPRDFQGRHGVTELTQHFTTSLERLIRKAPEQYFWVHRRWKSAPRSRRTSEKAA